MSALDVLQILKTFANFPINMRLMDAMINQLQLEIKSQMEEEPK